MPHPLSEMSGKRFGRLVVTERAGFAKGSPTAAWLCICDCGKQATVCGSKLRRGITKSCGCLSRECSRERLLELHNQFSIKHGHAIGGKSTPEYISWKGMKQRCNYPGHKDWKNYGGRGITICERWSGPDGFVNFLADMGPRPSGMTIDRENVNGNYEPNNCKWATAIEQANNRTNSARRMPVLFIPKTTPLFEEKS